MIPRGSRVLVVVGSEDAVAEVTARTMRRLAGCGERRRDEVDSELWNGAVLTQRKVEKIPEERAIVVVLVCLCVVDLEAERFCVILSFLLKFYREKRACST